MKKKNLTTRLSFSKETISNLSGVKGGMPIEVTKTCPKTQCYCPETKTFCHESVYICFPEI